MVAEALLIPKFLRASLFLVLLLSVGLGTAIARAVECDIGAQAADIEVYSDEFSTEVDDAFDVFSGSEGVPQLFDVDRAHQDGVSPEVIEVAETYNQMWREQRAKETGISTRQFPIDYGKWCGPNNTQSNANILGRNSLDNACRSHDLCLRYKNDPKCDCDCRFVVRLKQFRAEYPEGTRERTYLEAAIRIVPRWHRCNLAIRSNALG